MSAAAPPSAAAPAEGAPPPEPLAEACPLCGAPLAPDQEWCLRCGAAARTRLAAAPQWKAPLIALAVVAALALGALAAALVKLAGDSGPAPAPITRTITAAPAAGLPSAPAATGAAPGAAAPAGSAAATSKPPAATGAPTTTAPPPSATTTGSATTVTTSRGKGLLRSLSTK
ncbi:MAG: hypothetical protein ACLQBB_10510 [Solirubrobacteraceae bacterium]